MHPTDDLDWLLRGARVIDGTGRPAFGGDIGVAGDTVVMVAEGGAPASTRARRTLDLDGACVAPGFIDAHAHDEALLLEPPWPHPKLTQGVTTVVTGQCGISLAPLRAASVPAPLDILGAQRFRFDRMADYREALRSGGMATNVVALVGHSTLRAATMTDLDRPATGSEARRMRDLLARALHDGASGLSTGLFYPPARAATADEVIRVGEPLRDAMGVLTMHLRDESDRITEALDEAFAIGRALGVPLVLSHHKLLGTRNHGRSRETLPRVEAAARAMPVCLDCYPYDASSTLLMPERVSQCREVLITWSAPFPHAAGRTLRAWASDRGLSPEDAARALLPAGAVYFAMDEADVERILAHPLTMVGSDGLAHDRRPHPRLWGSFPRVLGRYVRERGLLTLEQAVHKMTGLPAQRHGLPDRGRIAVGCKADLVAFDPVRIQDRAGFDAPGEPAAGVIGVWLNGVAAWGTAVRDAPVRAGRWLRGRVSPVPRT